MRILITGASGFIGTNLLEHFRVHHDVLNLDILEPRNKKHLSYWKNVDIRDYESLRKAILDFYPDYILQLAAKTDFDGHSVEDYDANTIGVENVLKVAREVKQLKKIIITSSQAVTGGGYQPQHQKDYHTVTLYGDSKVITEENTWKNPPTCDWAIIRPTSIWGPWFGVPYRNFFDMIHKRLYFHIGHNSTTKTYGYVGNAVYQIEKILFSDTTDESNKVFYIGDNPPIFIEEWANEIGKELNIKIPRLPMWILKCVAKFGDCMYAITKKHFPLDSRRLHNMQSGVVRNLDNTYIIAPNPPYKRLTGVRETLKWLEWIK